MDIEVTKVIKQLEGSEAAKHKAGMKRAHELLEESYILNIRPSSELLDALEDFAVRGGVDTALKKRAKKLVKDYDI